MRLNYGGRAKFNGIELHNDKVSITITKSNEKMSFQMRELAEGSKWMDTACQFPLIRGVVQLIMLVVKVVQQSPKALAFLAVILLLCFSLASGSDGGANTDSGNPLFMKVYNLFVFALLFKLTDLGKYHAAEHMVISTLEKGLALSIENLAKQEPAQVKCGSVWGIYITLISLVFMALNVPPLVASLFAVSIGFELFLLDANSKPFMKPLQRFALFIQRHLFTSKPEQEHLEHALVLGQAMLFYHKTQSPESTRIMLEENLKKTMQDIAA